MLYSEFVAGTGCKQNDHNFQVYKELEIIYMNSNCSKAHIYEMGKKLVDNSKTEEELRFEAEIQAEIEQAKTEIESHKWMIAQREGILKLWIADGDKAMARAERQTIKYHKDMIRQYKSRIAALKWVLNG